MKNNYCLNRSTVRRYFLYFLILFSFSCEKKEIVPGPIVVEDKEKVIPEGSRKVTIKVDPKYDFSNTIIYGLRDSVSMSSPDKSLAVPKGSGDFVMIIDKNSEEILAVALLDSSGTELSINAKTVTAAMHDLIPNYLSLPESDRKDFDAIAPKLPEYITLVNIVDEIMGNKQTIYSTDERFIRQLLIVNSHITEKYFEKNADEGARFASDKDIKYWLVKNTVPGVTNQEYSHVDATFTPSLVDAGPAAKIYAVKPQPLPTAAEKNKPTPIPLSDGYYKVEISQKTPQAQKNNEKALAQGVINLIFGLISSHLTGTDMQKCTGALTLSVGNDISQGVLSPPTDWQSGALAVVKIGAKTFEKFIKSESCLRAFVDPKIILKSVVGHSNVYSASIKYAKAAIDIAELGPWVVGRWIDPIEYNTQMQVHNGEVIPGTIGFTMYEEGKLLESYKAGDRIHPVVQAKILSSYDKIFFDDYKIDVEWVVKEGHGTIGKITGLDNLGRSSTGWTLPLNGGQYRATAKIMNGNKPSNHLVGSPLEFKTSVLTDPASIAMISGDKQAGEPGEKLADPLKVIVKDKDGNFIKDAKVEWKVKSGGGSVSALETLTDDNGIAQVQWTLGNSGTQEVEATARKLDMSLVNGAPLIFTVASSIVGKWKSRNLVSYYDKKGGTLLDTEEEEPLYYLEFTESNVLLYSNEDDENEVGDTGNYSIEEENGFSYLTISGTSDMDDWNNRYKITEWTESNLVLMVDETHDDGSYVVLEVILSR